jgi:photosystem II stability/assembly factor-like uncharacterized protein
MTRNVWKTAVLTALVSSLLALAAAGSASAAPTPGSALSAGKSAPVHARRAVAASERLIKPALFAVSFADPKYGWAVGAQGAIFRTKDGGRHWVRQYLHGPWHVEEMVFGSV